MSSSRELPSLPTHILAQIASHFDAGNKIFWHTDRGHYSQPCWDRSAQAFSLACKDFRRLVMRRRMRVMVARAMDSWVEEAGWRLGEEIRESVRHIVLIRTSKSDEFNFFHTLPNLTTISNINLTNTHLFTFDQRRPSGMPPAKSITRFPHVTTLNAPQSDFVPLDLLPSTLPLIFRTFPNLHTLSFRPDVERHSARMETSPTVPPPILQLGSLKHLKLDIRRLDPDGPRAVEPNRVQEAVGGRGNAFLGLGNGWDRDLGFLKGLEGKGVEVLELVFSWHVCRRYATFLEYICEAVSHTNSDLLPFRILLITIRPSYHLSHPLHLCGPSDLLLQSHLPALLSHRPQLHKLEIRYVNSVDWQGEIEEVVVLRVVIEFIKDSGCLVGWRVEKSRIGDGGRAEGLVVEEDIGPELRDEERCVFVGADGVERLEYELEYRFQEESLKTTENVEPDSVDIDVLDVD